MTVNDRVVNGEQLYGAFTRVNGGSGDPQYTSLLPQFPTGIAGTSRSGITSWTGNFCLKFLRDSCGLHNS